MKVLYRFHSTGDDQIDANSINYLQKAQAYLKAELSQYEREPGAIQLWLDDDSRLNHTLIDCGPIEQEVRLVLQAFFDMDHEDRT